MHPSFSISCLSGAKMVFLPALLFLNGAFAGSLKADENNMRTLFEFTGKDPSPAWEATNDGVMGGLSKGGARLTEDGMLFSGVLSLENNGGFSSIHADGPFDLSPFDGIRLKVFGDGRSYQLRFRSDAIFENRGRVSFGKVFATVEGEWIDVFIPFDDLSQTWRGRALSGYTFNAADVRRIGFMLNDKKAGDFRLKIRWIGADTVEE